MSARDTLTPELRAEVLRLEDDLRARVASLQEVQAAWRAEYDAARAAERTAATWEAWVDERVTLAAVAWVLTTVFVRFCEDNDLVKPVWISGPRHREAIDAQQQFLRETARTNADVTDREWLLQAVEYLKSLPATAGLVDDTSPMWLVTPSGDAATRLLSFWRERDESGVLIRDLADADLDTRFLGDLYQDISEDAKKRYALLQTPVFVEEFILDRTLELSLRERPLDGFKMIDPTCGSGHFLLGAFQRLLDRWHKHAPGLDERERVQAALDSVYGVDINPFAVAIVRFRLTVAAAQACRLAQLEAAPSFKYHLAAGDSLLHGLDQSEFDLGATFSADRVAANFAYATENLAELQSILRSRQYDAVVGNPPYITVKDKALNKLYRTLYPSCRGTYALTVPFMERFFGLAKIGSAPGWVGQITSNSFMKREFGAPLIEKFLPTQDLRLIVDASGAYIPGHGTPTVIVTGRATRPASGSVRVVLSVRGEPGRPEVPADGRVWTSIVSHVDDPGWADDWINVADVERSTMSRHPWSLAGGGAPELLDAINKAGNPWKRAGRVGKFGIVGADQPLVQRPGVAVRHRLGEAWRPMMIGAGVRDWEGSFEDEVHFPYNEAHELIPDMPEATQRWLWPYREVLLNRVDFAGTYKETGKPWYGWHQLPRDAEFDAASLVWGEVATHNHFVLLRGRYPIKQTALVIKVRPGTSEDETLSALGLLNSSTVCFWLKQTCYPKGGDPSADGARVIGEPWEERYAFNATNVQVIPLVEEGPKEYARRLDQLASVRTSLRPGSIGSADVPARPRLDEARSRSSDLHRQMVSLQEELDWSVYRSYGLIEDDLTYVSNELPALSPGERAFEIVLARRIEAGDEDTEWFARHGSTPMTEVPEYWPTSYQKLVERRIQMIESNRFVRLLERPEHKRRWTCDTWPKEEDEALRNWLLDRLEARGLWSDPQGRPTPKSISVLADEVARDSDLVDVLAVWTGQRDVPVVSSLEKLLDSEAVPYLAAFRYKEPGLRKRLAWERTWRFQRREDATSKPIEEADPIPSKYGSADFLRPEYWSNRGPLDVPTERFVLYPGTSREGDSTPVLGWAGWDHAQQALALATLIQSGEQQGWSEERLTPLVAGLSELLPWVEQWHTEPDPLYGGSSPAEFHSDLLDNYMAKLGATRESLAGWRPPAVSRGRKAKS